MLGQWDPVGIVASLVLAVGGLILGAWGFRAARPERLIRSRARLPRDHRLGSARGSPRLRAGRGRGRPPRHVERPAQDRRRSAPGRRDRDDGGGRAHRARRDDRLARWSAARRSRRRRSCWARPRELLEAAYFGFLAAAYRRGDLSVVYPIARGTAPLLAVAIGIVILGERLGPSGIRRRRGAPRRAADAPAALAVPPALGGGARLVTRPLRLPLLTGVMIAAYSAVDRVGAQLVEPWLYAGFIWAFCIVFLWAWVVIAGGQFARWRALDSRAVRRSRGRPSAA